MKDEIKEILDKLYLDFEKAGLTAPEYSDLRDYITNLQEANKGLARTIIDYYELLMQMSNITNKVREYINSTDFIYDEQYKKKDKLENILNGGNE